MVFTNGVFDLLHAGHIDYLCAARQQGHCLVLGLNSDASVRRLGKAGDRPHNAHADRALVLAALESVSLVVVFDELTPARLLEELRPDIYVKGADYAMDALPEARQVQRWGGRTLTLPLRPGYSTTALVQRIRGAAPPPP